jgi:predicted ATPase/class 3 adenylate cyclase/DNA-binding CsgD family transcriptional regulator
MFVGHCRREGATMADGGVQISRLLVDGISGHAMQGFALPTGTVTFLLTDVEGSTRSWEDTPDATAVAISRHYQLLEAAISGRGGVQPVEQGEGDSVVGAFSRPSDAVAAALDAQQAFSLEPWPAGAALRVRMAIHTGEARLRDEGNYFGETVIRCARLRSIGHGGQVLVSDATAGLVADRLPAPLELTDLGTHRLKDLSRPERVWQLVHPDLQSSFPPLRSLDAFRHNLPLQLTPFIGRDDEITQVARLLANERLVTMTGSGGVGKTRLALAVAADAIERYPGGVWLVELAGVGHPDGVSSAALAAVGARQQSGRPLIDQLASALSDDPTLVVLDNCEHLADACAALIADLLMANPAVTVLTTSREPLGVPGETIWRVPSLDAPPAEGHTPVDALSQYDAVRLFVDRARRARPSFSVSDANAPAVAQICYRLDGIPLALELAAARCRQLTPERIAHDLDDRFSLLTGGARTVLPRHQTLMASIDWSHDRLEPTERLVFRRLGVFAGPFPLSAAEGVVSAPAGIEPVEVFDVVSRLVDKSLVLIAEADAEDSEPRYRLLETLRAYALRRAIDVGEIEALRRAHANWWLSWLDERWPTVHSDRVVEQVEEFHNNFKAALDWSFDEPELGLRLLRRLGRSWQNSGRPGEAMAAVDRLLTVENAERHPREWISAANAVSALVTTARGTEASDALTETVEGLAMEVGDAYHLAIAQWLSSYTPDRCRTVIDLARQNDDHYVAALATQALAQVEVEGDPASGIAMLDSPDVVAATNESSYVADWNRRTRCFASLSLGDLDRCGDLARQLSSSKSTLMVAAGLRYLSNVGLLSMDEDTLMFGIDLGEERLRDTPGTAMILETAIHRLALLHGGAARTEPEMHIDKLNLGSSNKDLYAREAIDAADGVFALQWIRSAADPRPQGRAMLAAVEAAATSDDNGWHEALRLAVDHDLRLLAVDAIEGLAAAAAEAESWADCLRLASAATELRESTGYRWRFGFEQQAFDHALEGARANLTSDLVDRAEYEGRAMRWRETAAYAQRARGERKRPRHGWASLTRTEAQVVALVADGLTNPQIAERLLMGRATVKTHLEHIFSKLGVTSRAELAAQAARRER